MTIDLSTLDLFRCPNYGGPRGTVMPRSSCAIRHEKAEARVRTDGQMTQSIDLDHCRGCAIGKDHAAKKRGALPAELSIVPVEAIAKSIKRGIGKRRCVVCRRHFRPSAPREATCGPKCKGKAAQATPYWSERGDGRRRSRG